MLSVACFVVATVARVEAVSDTYVLDLIVDETATADSTQKYKN